MKKIPGLNKWINVCVCVLERRNREPSQRTHIALSFPTCLSLWPLGADRFIVSGCLPAKKTFNTFYLHRCRHAMLTLIVFCRSAVAFTAQRYMLPKIPKWTTAKYLRHLILNHMIWTTPRFKLCFIQKWSSVISLILMGNRAVFVIWGCSSDHILSQRVHETGEKRCGRTRRHCYVKHVDKIHTTAVCARLSMSVSS